MFSNSSLIIPSWKSTSDFRTENQNPKPIEKSVLGLFSFHPDVLIYRKNVYFCAGRAQAPWPVFRQNAQLHNFFRNFFVYFAQIHFPEYRMYIYTLKMYKYTSLSPVYKYTSRVYIYTFLFFQKYFQKPIDKSRKVWYNIISREGKEAIPYDGKEMIK